jgi:hypothetical protein
MQISEITNLFENIILTELTDKVKQQQFVRLKKENNAKLDQLILQYNTMYNTIQPKKSDEDDDFDFIDFDDPVYQEMDRIRNEIEKEKMNIVPDEKIIMYINLWDEYSQGFPTQFKDITKLSLNQIIRLTRDADFKKYISGKSNKFFTDEGPNAELDTLYNSNNLVIMKGDLQEKCIAYGSGYSWCISRKDAQNMFFSYRMRKNEPMFYFVFDKDRTKNDTYHAIVIYVDNQNIFHVANANNLGDEQMDWDEIIEKQPKLTGLEGIFKHKPLTPEERADYLKYRKSASDATYENYSLEEKYKYFKFGNKLSDKQQDLTPDDLIGVYAKFMPTEINNDTWNRLKSGDKRKIIGDVVDESNNLDVAYFSAKVLKSPWHLLNLPKEIVDKVHNIITQSYTRSHNYARNIVQSHNIKSVPDVILNGIAQDHDTSLDFAEYLLLRNNYDQNIIPDIIIKSIATNFDSSNKYAYIIIDESDTNPNDIPIDIINRIKSKSNFNTDSATKLFIRILKKYNYDASYVPKALLTNSLEASDYARYILKNTKYNPSTVPNILHEMIGQNYYDAYDYAINDILDNNKYDPSIVPEEITNGISTSEKYSRLYAQYIMSNNNFDLTIVPKIILDSIKSDQYQKDIFDGYLEDNNVKKTESLNISRLKTLSGIK